jgi:Fe-S-cluster containining protein
MECNGSCCERFPLPVSFQMLRRWAQEGIAVNGTLEETKMLVGMLIPLTKEALLDGWKRYFFYTCKNFNTQTRKCMVYDKRPSLCRTYPDDTLCSKTMQGGCGMTCGTEVVEARRQFKTAHGIGWTTLTATDGKDYDYTKEDYKKCKPKRRAHRPCQKRHSTSQAQLVS